MEVSISCEPSENIDYVCKTFNENIIPSLNRIWYKEPLRLRQHQQLQIVGSFDYDDDVNDEWVAVHCLLQLSKQFDKLKIRVWDRDDGDFLLIESANRLPFDDAADDGDDDDVGHTLLVNGRCVVVTGPGGGDRQAWSTIVTDCVRTRCDQALAAVAEHKCVCVVPRRLRRVLRLAPQLVAPAVHALAARDARAVKACSTMSNFGGSDRPADGDPMVATTVRFSRMLYAKFMSLHGFRPPPSAGFESRCRRQQQVRLNTTASGLKNAIDMGARLSCSFECLLSRATDAAGQMLDTVDSFQRWMSGSYTAADHGNALVQALQLVDAGTVVDNDSDDELTNDSTDWLTHEPPPGVQEQAVDDEIILKTLHSLMLNVNDDDDDDGGGGFAINDEMKNAFKEALLQDPDGLGPASMLVNMFK